MSVQRHCVLLLCIFLLSHLGFVLAQTTIARWDFEDENLSVDEGAGTLSPDNDLGNKKYYGGNGGGFALSHNSWNGSIALDQDYIALEISTISFYEIQLSFDSRSTSTGPSQMRILVSKNNFTDYEQMADQSIQTDSDWHSHGSVTIGSTYANQTEIQIRIYGYNASAGTGTWRHDNIHITGQTEGSLPVQCSEVNAQRSDEGVIITWKTESEFDIQGYHVLRSLDENGSYTRITNNLVPGIGNHSDAHTYRFVDSAPIEENYLWYLIEAYSGDGIVNSFGPICVKQQRYNQNSHEFKLMPNYSNPFNPSTTIPFSLSKEQEGKYFQIRLYNCAGDQIMILKEGMSRAGQYSVQWNGCDQSGCEVASGIYIARLQVTNNQFQTRQLIKMN